MPSDRDIDSILRLLVDFRSRPRVSDRQPIYVLDFDVIYDFLWRDRRPVSLAPADSLPAIIENLVREEERHPDVPIAVVETVRKLEEVTPELMRHLKQQPQALDDLRWDIFEKVVAEFLASWHFDEVCLVGRNPSTAADIFAVKTLSSGGLSHRLFVEVKHWRDAVGVEVIDRVYGAMLAERPAIGWHSAMVVSRVSFSRFHKHTRRSLGLLGVELRDRQDLLRWLSEYEPKDGGLWLPGVLRPFTHGIKAQRDTEGDRDVDQPNNGTEPIR